MLFRARLCHLFGSRPVLAALLGAAALAPVLSVAAVPAPGAGSAAPPARKLDYDRDIRPILSESCFTCHGFDPNKRQAGLRLDLVAGATGKLPSGSIAIVPGNPGASALVARITARDESIMPPPGSRHALTPAQIRTLRQWVAQGAPYAPHWAFVPPTRPSLPQVRQSAWVRNPVDRFILARLEALGLPPSPEADRPTLVRRVSQDLRGLPPTLAEVNAFVGDTRPDAYERMVDRMLASPHYGERMALKWLDLARYADTHGYHIDSHRDMWRWRDWVIDAYNRNLPFDQFTTEQLAGDLLPNPTLDQRIATGFNRNHPINFEGGAIPEEYHANYIFDRIDTTSTTWLALSIRCGQCHTHKYDPITQRDYYRLFAYFHNVPEAGLDGTQGNARPFIKAPTPEQAERLAAFDQRIAGLEKERQARLQSATPAARLWARTVQGPSVPDPLTAGLVAHFPLDETAGETVRNLAGQGGTHPVQGKAEWAPGKLGGALRLNGTSVVDLGDAFSFDRESAVSYGGWVHPTSADAGVVIARMNDAAAFRGWDLYLAGGLVYVHLVHQWEQNAIRVNTQAPMPLNAWSHVLVSYDGSGKAAGVRVYVNGKSQPLQVTHDTLTGTLTTSTPTFLGQRNPGARFRGMLDDIRCYHRALPAAEVERLALGTGGGIAALLAQAPEQRSEAAIEALAAHYLERLDAPLVQATQELAKARKERSDLDGQVTTTMVMEEMATPRETFVLVRGQYNQKAEKVTPGVPEAIGTLPTGAPANRLGLARWLLDERNPLTARVAVNRYWEMLFGAGLVRTSENFGVKGERPSHPELLDWLATEYRRTGWDTKAMMRLLVTSATYRQTSAAGPASVRLDPENHFLSRGARFRLPAEFVRDQALVASGLLVPTLGGPSVKGYQPPGLWEEIAFGGSFSAQTYVQDHGEKLYRRGMYQFWKRTLPPPGLQTFDAPEREFCMVRRSVSNTPLQALVLWNDPTYVEAARKLAERMLSEIAASPRDRIRYGFRIVLARQPKDEELRVLMGVFEDRRAAYGRDRAAAEKLLSVGESPRNASLDVVQHAAYTAVANVLLTLDESITRN